MARSFMHILVAAAAALALPTQAQTASTLKIVVPFAPGGSTDIVARLVGMKLAESLGKTAVIENKPGAGGQIGILQVVRSTPDGNTLVVTPSGPISVTAHTAKLPYDPATDLTPVALVALVPTAIAVSADSPYKSVPELVAASKRNPAGISYGVAAYGTHMHLSGELLKAMTGANLIAIPYRGAAPTVAAIVSGEASVGIADLATLMPMARAGRLRILALTGARRTSIAPDVPTIDESGVKGYGADAWMGFFAPAGTPPEVIEKLNAAVSRILLQDDVKAALHASSLEPVSMSPSELRKFLASDYKQWGELIRKANIKME